MIVVVEGKETALLKLQATGTLFKFLPSNDYQNSNDDSSKYKKKIIPLTNSNPDKGRGVDRGNKRKSLSKTTATTKSTKAPTEKKKKKKLKLPL